MRKTILINLVLIAGISIGFSQTKNNNNKEVKQEIQTKQEIADNESLQWFTDLQKANELATKTHKPIFGFFTGSDWCGWCRKLQNDVFSKPSFIEWAKKNVVLLELDFPRAKKLTPELQQQNAGLQQAFQVNGYPTIWIFNIVKDDATNKFNLAALGSLGYPSGAIVGKEEITFLATANAILNPAKK
jgi:thioredoxin-related protein